ncbi:hypothetical protein N7490_006748 [Penicillium lividum]|nr:hypothetical protein N7490_006748 [Penicillium lividum]
MFFFEFNATPIPGASEILTRVLVKIPSAKFQISQDHSLGNIDPNNRCIPYGYYRKRVAFHVASLEERFTINIANGTYYKKISGFLKCAQEFLKA